MSDDYDTDKETFERHFGPKRTIVPAIVVSFDAGGPGQGPTVSARVIVRTPFVQEDGSRIFYESPTVERVPVWYPGNGLGAGKVSITQRLVPGQEVTLLVADRSHDEYRAGASLGAGGIVPFDDVRRNDLSDSICLPGTLRPDAGDVSAYIPEAAGSLWLNADTVRVNGGTLAVGLAEVIRAYVAEVVAAIPHSHSVTVDTGTGVGATTSTISAALPAPPSVGDFSSEKLFTDG